GKSFHCFACIMPEGAWTTHLCDCFADANTCCYGFWCCPCLACTVSGKFQECYCLPLSCGVPIFIPPASLTLRASIRNRYGIKGSICNDMVVSAFCLWCSWCQMHRELKARDKTTVVITQPAPAPVINVQANPVMVVNQAPGLQYANPNPAPPPSGYGAQYNNPNPPPYPYGV
uniref:Cornifelin homolog B-like n=1 Tax=Cyprinodon variegatus TaxID=28743 RepID=A0A3Q2E1P5_CYPVA